jgi:hypothetical protein
VRYTSPDCTGTPYLYYDPATDLLPAFFTSGGVLYYPDTSAAQTLQINSETNSLLGAAGCSTLTQPEASHKSLRQEAVLCNGPVEMGEAKRKFRIRRRGSSPV